MAGMDLNVLQRFLKGVGANIYNQAVTVVVQLVGVPILLSAWGAQLYGEWLIIFAIPAYLSMTDLGFSQSAGNDMTARLGRGDYSGAVTVFQSLVALVYGIAFAGLVLIAVVLFAMPLASWMNFDALSSSDVYLALFLLAAEMFVRLLDGVNHAGFRAAGEYALHFGLNSTVRLVQFSAIWLVALAGGGPVAAAAAFLLVRALTVPALAFLLAQRHPWLRFGVSGAHRTELHRLVKPALANIAMPFAQALNIQGIVLVVGAVLGPLAVVTFSTLRTLTRLSLQLVQTVSNPAEPELARAYGADDPALIRSLFVHALRAGLWLALASALGLALFGAVILHAWTQGAVRMDPLLFAWLLGSAIAGSLWYSCFVVLKAANQHLKAASVLVFASAAAVAVAGLLLVYTGALPNAGLALLFMDGAMALYMLSSVSRVTLVGTGASLIQAANPYPLIAFARSKITGSWTHASAKWRIDP